MIRTNILEPNFDILFPYESLPWRLEVNRDCHNIKGIALTVCHFECEEHLQKYIDRYKLKPKDFLVSNRDGKPLKSNQKQKRSVRPSKSNDRDGSSSTVRKRKSSVDSSRNVSGNTKRKRK